MPSSTGNRALDLALMTALQACVWDLTQSLRETQARVEVMRCELLVNGLTALTDPAAP